MRAWLATCAVGLASCGTEPPPEEPDVAVVGESAHLEAAVTDCSIAGEVLEIRLRADFDDPTWIDDETRYYSGVVMQRVAADGERRPFAGRVDGPVLWWSTEIDPLSPTLVYSRSPDTDPAIERVTYAVAPQHNWTETSDYTFTGDVSVVADDARCAGELTVRHLLGDDASFALRFPFDTATTR